MKNPAELDSNEGPMGRFFRNPGIALYNTLKASQLQAETVAKEFKDLAVTNGVALVGSATLGALGSKIIPALNAALHLPGLAAGTVDVAAATTIVGISFGLARELKNSITQHGENKADAVNFDNQAKNLAQTLASQGVSLGRLPDQRTKPALS